MDDLWVLDDAGITVPTASELIDQAKEELATTGRLGGDYLFHPEDPITQLVEVVGFALASAYQLAEVLFNSRDPDQAQGVLLRESGSLVGAEIPQPTRSVIAGRFVGNPGVLVKSGSIFKYLATGDLWQTFQSYTIGPSGTVDAELESIEFAAVEASAAALSAWETQTPTTGLLGFLSTEAADVGRAAATNAETREAIRLAAEGGAGAATYDADVANVAGVDGVDHIALFVNRSLVYDADLDLDGKKARFVISGGRKQALFDAIAASKSTSLECADTGTVQGTSTRPDGKILDVSYSRPVDVPILMKVTISGDLPDANEVEAVIYEAVEARAALQDFAERVVPAQYQGAIIGAFGENEVESCVVQVRLTPLDLWQTTPLDLAQVERATISSTPRPAQVVSVAEDPITVVAGQDLTVTVDGGAPQVVTLVDSHATVASLLSELAVLTDCEAVDYDGRLLIRTTSTGGASSLQVSGTLLVPLGIAAATYAGTDSDIEVVIT